MSGAVVGVEGIKKLNIVLAELQQAIPQDVEYALGRGLLIIEAEAKKLCPVDQGRLKNSITMETRQTADGTVTGAVGTNVEYAADVEYGTGIHAENKKGRQTPWLAKIRYEDLSVKQKAKVDKDGKPVFKPSKNGFVGFWTHGMHPHPFLRPAVDNKADEAVEEIRESLLDCHFGRI